MLRRENLVRGEFSFEDRPVAGAPRRDTFAQERGVLKISAGWCHCNSLTTTEEARLRPSR
jgi:hypothetical protein